MSELSRTQYSILNIVASFVGYGINIVLSFICRIIFVRVLQEEYLGINGLFSNILSMLSLTELGIGSAIVYALYEPIANNNKPQIAALMKIYATAYKTIGIIIGIAGLCLVPFLSLFIRETPQISENLENIYLLYLFSTASSYFFSYRGSIITAYQRNYIVVSISYIMIAIQDIFQIVILVMTHDFMLYLIVQVICTYVTNFLISRKAKKDYPFICSENILPLSKEEKRKLIKNIKALTISKLAGILVNNTDNIVITYFEGLVKTGITSNYTLIIGILSSLTNQFFSSISASVGNLNATETNQRKYDFFRILNLSNFWLFGLATIYIITISDDIVSLCFGHKYVLNWDITLILAINFYIIGMQNAVWIYKSTLGLFRHGQYLLFITAALNILGDVLLGTKYGLAGILVATVIARLFTTVWYDPYAVYKYGLGVSPIEYIFIYVKYGILLILTILISVAICSTIKTVLVLKIFIKIILCTCIVNMLFILAFYKTTEFKQLLMIIRRFKKKYE